MTGELLNLYTSSIRTLTLIPSSGGRFEVMANNTVIYSKKTIGRHAEPGEIARLLEQQLGMRPSPREE